MEKIKELTEAFHAISRKDWRRVIEFYEEKPDYMMFPLNINRDTVFHLAMYSKKKEPFITLQQILKKYAKGNVEELFFSSNQKGNTILHEAVCTGNLEVIRRIVLDYRKLIRKINELGETPLYTAAAFGQGKIIKFFTEFYGPETLLKIMSRWERRKIDGKSIIQVAIEGEHFETALLLINLLKKEQGHRILWLRDKKGMSALDCLANLTSAFRSGYTMGVFESILYFSINVQDDIPAAATVSTREDYGRFAILYFKVLEGIKKSIWMFVPGWVEEVWKEKRKHKLALKLARLLIKETIWDDEFGGISSKTKSEASPSDNIGYWSDYSSEGELPNKAYPNKNTEQQTVEEDRSQGNKYSNINSEDDDENVKQDDEFRGDKSKENSSIKNNKQSSSDDKFRSNTFKENSSKNTGESTEYREPSANNTDNKRNPSREPPGQDDSNEDDYEGKQNLKTEGTSDKWRRNESSTTTTFAHPMHLFRATRMGIVEIVQEAIKEYPQAIEHLNDKGQNILHVAVSYRRKDIFEMLKTMKIPWMRMTQVIDGYGYTLLHHVADTKNYIRGTKPGPALQLQEELLWFDLVQKEVPSYYAMHHDNSKTSRTPMQLFEKKHEEQLHHAQKWAKETSQSCSTVAVLVATVVFAAAYTVPGGTNDKGYPNFLDSPYFLAFTIMDVIALACSLTSVVVFLSILTSPFELDDFRKSIPQKLIFGFTMLFFSVFTTMLVFGSTILLVIRKEKQLTASLISVAAFFPVSVFAILQSRLYGTMLKDVLSFLTKYVPCFRAFSRSCRHRKFP